MTPVLASSNTLSYLALWATFSSLILLALAALLYSRWQVLGPKFKKQKTAIKAKFGKKTGPRVKKGAVITSPEELEALAKQKSSAETAQDLIKAHQADVSRLQAEQDALDKYNKKKNKSKKDTRLETDDNSTAKSIFADEPMSAQEKLSIQSKTEETSEEQLFYKVEKEIKIEDIESKDNKEN